MHIWDDWAAADGELGPVYGAQWRSWPAADGTHVDQISDVIEQMRCNPDSRRLLVVAWNPAALRILLSRPDTSAGNGSEPPSEAERAAGRYSWDMVTDGYEELFNRLTGKGADPARQTADG